MYFRSTQRSALNSKWHIWGCSDAYVVNAIPLKTVHFEYTENLCKGIPNTSNSNKGKLTLDKLYFTYGNSVKGEYSKYRFNYGNTVEENPDYHPKAQDRWGMYKEEPNAASLNDYDPSMIQLGASLSNSDFPYAEQNKADADTYAAVWSLKQIELPSGGKINIEYEADDYAYVQDKRAGQMFKLSGLSSDEPTSTGALTNRLINESTSNLIRSGFNNYLTFLIDQETSVTLNKSEFYNSYLDGIGKLYFRCLVNIYDGNYEFVPGYADIEDYGTFFQAGVGNFGWIKLKSVGFDDNDGKGSINPIAKAAMQFARLNMPDLVYPGKDLDNNLFERTIKSMIGIFTKEIPRMIRGFNRSLSKEGYAKGMISGKSWIRLNNPNYQKLGGGHRVKKISMTDEWSTITGNTDHLNVSYGQQFFYKKMITTPSGEKKMISSGVASYEPMLGGDEISLRQPIAINESRFLAPDNEHYIEAPLGESFFPNASVGYSQVIVADIRPSGVSKKTTTGFTVSEFYTVKDFPYKTLVNEGQTIRHKPGILANIFKLRTEDFVTASQGYSIVLNDMHGKPKSTWIHGGALSSNGTDLFITPSDFDKENRISGQEFIYKMDDNNNLDNEVKVVKPDGELADAIVGVESEMVLDFRENLSNANRVGIEANVDTWLIQLIIAVIPVVAPTIWGSLNSSTTRFRSSVATKVVNQHGLLDKVKVFDKGSIIETQNLIYDAETGEVLVTSVNNEFRDKTSDNIVDQSGDNLIYNMKYPAHWAYSGMQAAYQNIGVEMDVRVNAQGEIEVDNPEQIFHLGDEVSARILTDNDPLGRVRVGGSIKFWVAAINTDLPNSNDNIQLIDRDGTLLTDNYLNWGFATLPDWRIKIVRSGHRNQQSLPIANMVSLNNPAEHLLGPLSSSLTNDNSEMNQQATALEVIDFSAQEFSDQWQGFCGDGGLMTTSKTDTIETCLDCADFIFMIDISESITTAEFENVRQSVTNTIESLSQKENTDFRYAIVQWFNTSIISVPFTRNVDVATDFIEFDNGTDLQTMLNPALGDLITHLNNDDLEVREECTPMIVMYTDADDSNNGILPYTNANTLKNPPFNMVFSVIKYPSGNDPLGLADEQMAAVASPGGWDYTGMVANNGDDYTQLPRRIMIKSIFDPNLDIADDLHCQVQEATRTVTSPALCGVTDGDIINPYFNGVLGNWRPTKSYVHDHVPREQESVAVVTGENGPGVEVKGYYSLFDQFWNRPAAQGQLWTPDDREYIATTEITKYNPYGEALESKDALGNYSAALLGYDKKLVIAAGSNTRYQDMAFDGFEEYNYYVDNNLCHSNYHFNMDPSPTELSNTESHTGDHSLIVANGTVFNKTLNFNCQTSPTPGQPAVPFVLSECVDCLTSFRPGIDGANNSMVVDVWVKNWDDVNNDFFVQFIGGSVEVGDFDPIGPVIDGWQRIYGFVDLPTDITSMTIAINNSSGNDVFVDDLRIYPFDANMKSFVYHPLSLKLTAELDENNHATFYEYDEEWNLIRVKKETERGVMTLQENRSSVRLDRVN